MPNFNRSDAVRIMSTPDHVKSGLAGAVGYIFTSPLVMGGFDDRIIYYEVGLLGGLGIVDVAEDDLASLSPLEILALEAE